MISHGRRELTLFVAKFINERLLLLITPQTQTQQICISPTHLLIYQNDQIIK